MMNKGPSIMKQLPEHGRCFVCGNENESSIGIQWYVREDNSIFGEITLTDQQQGPPGHAHGGASAALLDEAMGAAVWLAGHMVLAANLNVNYRRPIPLHVPIKITAWVSSQERRKVFSEGRIQLTDGTVLVEASGIFVEVKEMFAKFTDQFQAYQQQNGEDDT